MWMRALKEVTSRTAAEEEKETLVRKLWITCSEGAVMSSDVTMASVNLEFRTVRLTLMGRDSVVGKPTRRSNHFGGGARFPQQSRPVPGPIQPPVHGVPNLTAVDTADLTWR